MQKIYNKIILIVGPILCMSIMSCDNTMQEKKNVINNKSHSSNDQMKTINGVLLKNAIVVNLKSNAILNIKQVEELTKSEELNSYTMSNEEKIDALIEEFNVNKMDKSLRKEEGINDISDLINKIFDLSRPITDGDIEDIKRLDIMELFKVTDRASYHLLPKERVFQLYEIIIENNPPNYMKLDCYYMCATMTSGHKKQEFLDKAMKFGDENNKDSKVARSQTHMMVYLHSISWNAKEYEKTLPICDKIIDVARLHPNDKWSYEVENEGCFWKVYALGLMGKIDEGRALYEKLIKRDLHPSRERILRRESFKKRLKID